MQNGFSTTIYIKTKFNQAHLIKDATKDFTVILVAHLFANVVRNEKENIGSQLFLI